MALAWKAGKVQAFVGSNPTLSASYFSVRAVVDLATGSKAIRGQPFAKETLPAMVGLRASPPFGQIEQEPAYKSVSLSGR